MIFDIFKKRIYFFGFFKSQNFKILISSITREYCIFCEYNKVPILKCHFVFILKIFRYFGFPWCKSRNIIEINIIYSFISMATIFLIDKVYYLLSFIIVFITRLHGVNQLYQTIIWYIECLLKRFFLFVFIINFNCDWEYVFYRLLCLIQTWESSKHKTLR